MTSYSIFRSVEESSRKSRGVVERGFIKKSLQVGNEKGRPKPPFFN